MRINQINISSVIFIVQYLLIASRYKSSVVRAFVNDWYLSSILIFIQKIITKKIFTMVTYIKNESKEELPFLLKKALFKTIPVSYYKSLNSIPDCV